MNDDRVIFLFDGSWDGLMTCIYESFYRKIFKVDLQIESAFNPGMFEKPFSVISDVELSKRVWKGLKKKLDATSRKEFLYTFLSEEVDAFQHLFNYAVYVLQNKKDVTKNYGNESVLALSQYAKSVSREAHRMKAFIRFQKWSDGTFFCIIHPDFNVIPIITKHFVDRYADQHWIIYDEKRKYGIYFDTMNLHDVSFEHFQSQNHQQTLAEIGMDELEQKFDLLWKDYYQSANIASRKNPKLHKQHVPIRYWKYLNEIQL